MKTISLKVGIPVNRIDNLLWAEVLTPIDQNDLGCAVQLYNHALYEIDQICRQGKIIALLPLNGEAVELNDNIKLNVYDGIVYNFLVRESNKMRRLIEDGETHAEFEARKFNIKLTEEREKTGHNIQLVRTNYCDYQDGKLMKEENCSKVFLDGKEVEPEKVEDRNVCRDEHGNIVLEWVDKISNDNLYEKMLDARSKYRLQEK